MSIVFKSMFNQKLTKYTGLLLVLIFILILFLLNMDNIINYLANKKFNFKINNHNNSFNNIKHIQGYDNDKANSYLSVKEGFLSRESFTDTEPVGAMEQVNDRNYKVDINPRNRSVSISFKGIDNLTSNNKLHGYLLILAKYNSSLEQIGHLNARISLEGLDFYTMLNDLKENGYITAESLETLNNDLRGEVFNVNIINILRAFTNTFGSVTFNDIRSNTNNSQEDIQDKFLELLEKIYNEIYYKRAFKLTDTNYNNGIKQLYNNFNSIIINSKKFPTLDKYETDSGIVDEQNENDRKLIIIKKNNADAISLRKKIDSSTIKFNPKLKKFIIKFLNKYERLSLDNNSNLGNGLCNIDKQCNYTFENLEDKDSSGNFYYYKLGIGLIYNNLKVKNKNTEKISNIYTYKYGTGGSMMYFKIDNSLEEQERIIRRLEDITRNSILSKTEANKPLQPMPDAGDTISIDAYMKMLEPHIGNYPDEFTLREQDVQDLSLSNYLNKNLSSGTINVGVEINDINVKND